MTTEQFFVLIACGAVALLAGIVAWSVMRGVEHANKLSQVVGSVDDLKRRADVCDADRLSVSGALSEMRAGLATLVERSFHQTQALSRIEGCTVTAPPAPRKQRPAPDG